MAARRWLDAVPGGVVVQSAGDGRAAIDAVGAADPDVIILDIELPVMDGLTALPEILRRAPEAKVIVASTLSRRNAEATLKAMSPGATDYIAKPSFWRDGNSAREAFQIELVRKVKGVSPSGGAVPVAAHEDDGHWTPVPQSGGGRLNAGRGSPGHVTCLKRFETHDPGP